MSNKTESQYRVFCIKCDDQPVVVGYTQQQGTLVSFMKKVYINPAFTPAQAASSRPLMVKMRELGSREVALTRLTIVELAVVGNLPDATDLRTKFMNELNPSWQSAGNGNAAEKPSEARDGANDVDPSQPLPKKRTVARKGKAAASGGSTAKRGGYSHEQICEDYYNGGIRSEKEMQTKHNAPGLRLSTLLKGSKRAAEWRQANGVTEVILPKA